MAATNYLENKIADHLFRATSYSKPAALYIGLFTAAPSDTGGGTEVTGGSYARVVRSPSDTNWTATQGGTTGASSGTGGQVTNASIVTFPAPTATWGTVTHFGIFDASTSGNLLFYGALTSSRLISNGDGAPSFAAGTLTVTVA